MPATPPSEMPGVTLLERGWLSSNSILLHGAGEGAVLIDAGHCVHAGQTVALVQHALQGEALRALVNTHLHSDHCGGNAAVQRHFGCTLHMPPGDWDAVQAWDESRLSYRATGQRCEPFVPDGRMRPGDSLRVAGRTWKALAAPGHDPHSLIFFDDQDGIVITADALWEHGFGIVFPELDGAAAFDEVAATLDLIESLGARRALPGHGAAFSDVQGALVRARQRLAAFRADPQRHARHAMKALISFHVMEVGHEPLHALQTWLLAAPLYGQVWERLGAPGGSLAAYGQTLVEDLCKAGVLQRREGEIFSA
ncbi:MBL fold metallo-hydrolase [Rubrivivax rivuli]|uniref:MBL fold metallo-hydrolase n=1 Tax=Rubrivivax rivuli TaxID=1862385 RepID=A0A437RD31_9BURK|nr:MBL fold metallo-hydrolase [Rubrivivax rivuli]RVU44654.1 MBL fold metallo-hydrolase [Rubrivivax rivuli]